MLPRGLEDIYPMETARHPVADYPVPVYDTLRRDSCCKGAGSGMFLAVSSLNIKVFLRLP